MTRTDAAHRTDTHAAACGAACMPDDPYYAGTCVCTCHDTTERNTTVNTTTTYTCETTKREGGPCRKPATMAAPNWNGTLAPICKMHLAAANRSRYVTPIVGQPIEGDIAATIDARLTAAREASAARMGAQAKERAERAAQITAQSWVDAAREWEVVYEPYTEYDFATHSEVPVQTWIVRPITTDGVARWDQITVSVKQTAGRPAMIETHGAGSNTDAKAALAFAQALLQAAAVAARQTAAAKADR